MRDILIIIFYSLLIIFGFQMISVGHLQRKLLKKEIERLNLISEGDEDEAC